PVAKTLGILWLIVFIPAFLSLFPGHVQWLQVIPIEGLLGRIIGDALIHYLNLAGAYIVCATVLAVALYLTTAFSFSSMQVWIPTRFAFLMALRDRWRDWRGGGGELRVEKELEKKRAARVGVGQPQAPGRPPTPGRAASSRARA